MITTPYIQRSHRVHKNRIAISSLVDNWVRVTVLVLFGITGSMAFAADPDIDLTRSYKEGKYQELQSYFENYPNDGEALYYYGLMLVHGKGIARDTEKGREILESAAEQGEPKAQLYLGFLYDSGRIIDESGKGNERAKKYYEDVINAGKNESDVAKAYYNLGVMYFEGRLGKHPDFVRALENYKLAAQETCFTPALNNLAFMYSNGLGEEGAVEHEKAVYYYRQAAQRRDGRAAYNLANAFLQGRGTEQSFLDAYKWFQISTYLQGTNDAALRTAGIIRDDILTPEQVTEANREIDAFRLSTGVGPESECIFKPISQ